MIFIRGPKIILIYDKNVNWVSKLTIYSKVTIEEFESKINGPTP